MAIRRLDVGGDVDTSSIRAMPLDHSRTYARHTACSKGATMKNLMLVLVALVSCKKGPTARNQMEIGKTGFWISLPDGVTITDEGIGWRFKKGDLAVGGCMKADLVPADPQEHCGLPEPRELPMGNGKLTACKDGDKARAVSWVKRSDLILTCRYEDASLELAAEVCQTLVSGKPINF